VNVPDVRDKRKNWTENISDYDKEKLVFLDESGVNTNMTRIYGRALGGARSVDKAPLNTPLNTTILSSIRINGETSYTTYSGGTTKDKFVEYLKNILIPALHDGDIIVMDNMRSHHVKEVSEIINNSEKHLTLLYLPPYSPDFNPIEMMWSKIKSVLRMIKIRNFSMLQNAIKTAFSKITSSDCVGWFSAVGLR
jgi:transposase